MHKSKIIVYGVSGSLALTEGEADDKDTCRDFLLLTTPTTDHLPSFGGHER